MDAKAIVWPVKTREVRNAYQDSTRWNGFAFRDDDIVVATWAKTGTTWTQQIVDQLIRGAPEALFDSFLCPWVDMCAIPFEPMMAALAANPGRRSLKTHLPIDALVFSPDAKYIFVGRDARDVVWSSYNHQAGYTDEGLAAFNAMPDRIGPPMARPHGDVREYYLDFLEKDEWPGYGGNPFWAHTQGWWSARSLPNVLMVHFANLKADMAGQIARIADFLDIEIKADAWPRILKHCSFEFMQANAGGERLAAVWKEGAKTFFNKGTNGRWRDVLSAEEIARCDEVAAVHLAPDCAHWLRTGEGGVTPHLDAVGA